MTLWMILDCERQEQRQVRPKFGSRVFIGDTESVNEARKTRGRSASRIQRHHLLLSWKKKADGSDIWSAIPMKDGVPKIDGIV